MVIDICLSCSSAPRNWRQRLALMFVVSVLLTGCTAAPISRCRKIISSQHASTTCARDAKLLPNVKYALAVKPYQNHGHRSVNVKVAGKSLPFLFDTGGGVTLLTPTLAKAAGCEPFGRLVGFRMRGERVTFPRCDAVRLEVDGMLLAAGPVGVFDLNALIPPDWPTLGGMITLASFEDQLVTLELGKGRVFIEAPPAPSEDVAPLRIVRQASGYSVVVLVPVDTPKGQLWLELDTGSDAPLMLAPHAAKILGVDLNAEGVVHKAPPDGSKGGRQLWKVPSVRIELPGVGPVTTPATVTDIIYDGNIGAPLIERYRWSLDLKNLQVDIQHVEN